MLQLVSIHWGPLDEPHEDVIIHDGVPARRLAVPNYYDEGQTVEESIFCPSTRWAASYIAALVARGYPGPEPHGTDLEMRAFGRALRRILTERPPVRITAKLLISQFDFKEGWEMFLTGQPDDCGCPVRAGGSLGQDERNWSFECHLCGASGVAYGFRYPYDAQAFLETHPEAQRM